MKIFIQIFFILISIFLVGCKQEHRDPNIFVVASAGDMPPFNYYDLNKKEIAGFDIDLSKEIAKRLNKKIQIELAPFSRLNTLLVSDRVDMIASALDNITEMKSVADFTDPYMYAITYFAVKKNTEILSIYEVLGTDMLIGATNGTSAARYLSQQGLLDNTSIFPSKTDLYLALNNNKIIGILADNDELKYLQKNEQSDLQKVGDPVYDHFMCFAVNKSNKKLLQQVNQIIGNMKNDGTYCKIAKKYLEQIPFPKDVKCFDNTKNSPDTNYGNN